MSMLRKTRGAPKHFQRPARVVLAGLLTSAAILGFLLLALNAYNGIPLVKYRTVMVSLPNIGHLKKHDPVQIAGVRVGQVLRTSTKDNQALLELQLQGVGPLAQDSRAIVRAQGLLGSRFVELVPGKSNTMLPDGGTITMDAKKGLSYTDGVPETLDLFDGPTRTALGQMTRGIGEGLSGRGSQLNQAIKVGPQSGADFNTTAEAILDRPEAAANFLPALRGGMGALNAAKEDFANLMRPGADTADTFVDERDAVQEAIGIMPTWFTTLQTALGTYDNPNPGIDVMFALDDLAESAARVMPGVPSGLRSAATLLEQAAEPLARTKPLLDEVPRVVPAALDILDALRPNLRPLRQAFTNLVEPVGQLARHGCDIQAFATGTRSMVNWGTTPGGNYGPNVGFPLTVILGPQEANTSFNTGFNFPDENVYGEPCEFAPGDVITDVFDIDISGAFPR